MTIQHMLLIPLPDVIYTVTSVGTGSYTTPAGYNRVSLEAISGGGNGFGGATSTRAPGGGGQYAEVVNISVTPSSTVIYYSVGNIATDSWANVTGNAAPTANTTGCLAKAGTSATSGVPGVGNAAGSIGTTIFFGGSNAQGSNPGGGGAGASGNASGQTAGTDTTLLSPGNIMGGGTGGTYNSGTGTAPGGAGGAATAGTGNLAGTAGRIRIRFTQYSV